MKEHHAPHEKESARTVFLRLINELLKQGRQLTYASIGREYERRYPGLTARDRTRSESQKSYYEPMHKAVADISALLRAQGLSLIKSGNNRTGYTYAYPDGFPGIDDWLARRERQREQLHLRQKQLLRLISASSGLLPQSWTVNLSHQLQQLAQDEPLPARKVIEFDYNDRLTNLELIPLFYDAIEKQKVLRLTNVASFRYERPIVFCPYYLKEYQHRWFCLGRCQEPDGRVRPDYIVALDRVRDVALAPPGVAYVPPERDYSHYFSDIVGVRHETHPATGRPLPVAHILIETRSHYTHGRILSKPLHPSLRQVAPFGQGPGGMGQVSVSVVPNLELSALLLSYGPNIRVLQPPSLVQQMAALARRMARLYQQPSDPPHTL